MRAHKASATARVIAAASVLHHEQFPHDPRVSPQMSALCWQFLQSCRTDRLLAASARVPLARWMWRSMERATLPGIVSHYLNRKARIESTLRGLLAEYTIAEVIVLGAGLDTLAARLAPEFPGVAFIEIDHPATQSVKREGLARAGVVAENLTLQACDLQTALPMQLLNPSRAPRVVIAEGLLMYFEAARVREILQAALGAGHASAHVLFTYMEARADGAIGFTPHSALIGAWLRMKREPFKWAIECAEVSALAISLNARLDLHERADDFSKASPPCVLRGENLALFQRVV